MTGLVDPKRRHALRWPRAEASRRSRELLFVAKNSHPFHKLQDFQQPGERRTETTRDAERHSHKNAGAWLPTPNHDQSPVPPSSQARSPLADHRDKLHFIEPARVRASPRPGLLARPGS